MPMFSRDKAVPPAPDYSVLYPALNDLGVSKVTRVTNVTKTLGGQWSDVELGEFTPFNRSGAALNAVLAAVVRPVVARALQVTWTGAGSELMQRVHSAYSPRQFWEAALVGVLTSRGVGFYRVGERLHFAPAPDLNAPYSGEIIDPRTNRSGNNETWIVNEWEPEAGSTKVRMVPFRDLRLARYLAVPNEMDGVSPLESATIEVEAYTLAVALMRDYALRGHKIGSELSIDASILDVAHAKKYVEAANNTLKEDGNYLATYTERGFSQKFPTASVAPKLAELLTEATKAVCRVYSVPPTIVGIQETSTAMSADEAEEKLLRDAVEPLLDSVLDACRVVLDTPALGYDTSQLARPGFSGMVRAVRELGQVGAVTINELRAMINLPPLADGDKLPESAGAGYRGSGDLGGEQDSEKEADS